MASGKANSEFNTAFSRVDGNDPFPWQRELYARFKNATIERSIDIPTGLGKTAVMAIWLLARAAWGGFATVGWFMPLTDVR